MPKLALRQIIKVVNRERVNKDIPMKVMRLKHIIKDLGARMKNLNNKKSLEEAFPLKNKEIRKSKINHKGVNKLNLWHKDCEVNHPKINGRLRALIVSGYPRAFHLGIQEEW